MFNYRYHVITIVAIFLALAIGLLLGVTIADKIVSGAEKDLRGSLLDDLDQARKERNKALNELSHSRQFENQVFPVIVQGVLSGRRIGIFSFGATPEAVVSDVREALEPSGAKLVVIASFRAPLRSDQLTQELEDTQYYDLGENRETLAKLGQQLGTDIVAGGGLPVQLKQQLFSDLSGSLSGLDAALFYRGESDLEGERKDITENLEGSVIKGLISEKIAVVGVERSKDENSQINFYRDHDLTSVDDIDLVAGKVALVFSLLGAKGQFGVKSTANQLLPQTLVTEKP